MKKGNIPFIVAALGFGALLVGMRVAASRRELEADEVVLIGPGLEKNKSMRTASNGDVLLEAMDGRRRRRRRKRRKAKRQVRKTGRKLKRRRRKLKRSTRRRDRAARRGRTAKTRIGRRIGRRRAARRGKRVVKRTARRTRAEQAHKQAITRREVLRGLVDNGGGLNPEDVEAFPLEDGFGDEFVDDEFYEEEDAAPNSTLPIIAGAAALGLLVLTQA